MGAVLNSDTRILSSGPYFTGDIYSKEPDVDELEPGLCEEDGRRPFQARDPSRNGEAQSEEDTGVV